MAQQVGGQVVGNIGMYYAAYRLSQQGWNVMPTARNARGADLLAYDVGAHIYKGIQVKALSKRNPVPLGNSLQPSDSLILNTMHPGGKVLVTELRSTIAGDDSATIGEGVGQDRSSSLLAVRKSSRSPRPMFGAHFGQVLCPRLPIIGSPFRPFEMVQVGPHLDLCVWSKKRATLTMLRRNYYEKAFALRNGNNLFCRPGAYCTRAIGL
jgi:hypothetical protein